MDDHKHTRLTCRYTRPSSSHHQARQGQCTSRLFCLVMSVFPVRHPWLVDAYVMYNEIKDKINVKDW